MTSNLANILDKNCPLRTLEIAFQNVKIFNIFYGSMPPDSPSSSHPQPSCTDCPVILILWDSPNFAWKSQIQTNMQSG